MSEEPGKQIKSLKEIVRNKVWNTLVKEGVALPPFPVHGRIPNFRGAELAAKRLFSEPSWRKSLVVKVNPDSPQKWVRLRALEEGKILIMPTPRIREGFILINPRLIPQSLYDKASTIKGAFQLGVLLKTAQELMRAIDKVDFIVEGSVAVNRYGERLGKGEGYGELEYAILLELKLIDPNIPIATTVHDLQVLEEKLPQDPYDVPVDIICTPTKTIRVESRGARPKGILWDLLSIEKLESIPILRELRHARDASSIR